MTTSFAQLAPPRTSIVLAPSRYVIDLDDPTCTVCGYHAVGMVETETGSDNGEDRREFCANHAVDVQTAALLADSFTPPVVTFFNLDTYRPWGSEVAA